VQVSRCSESKHGTGIDYDVTADRRHCVRRHFTDMQEVNADLGYYFTTTVPPEGLNFAPTRASIARAPLKIVPITISRRGPFVQDRRHENGDSW
jgi:hypothetical protein